MVDARTIPVLEKLLDKVPADKLEILLKPENLLELLQLHGQDKAAITKALKGGKLPGELLLELLEREPDPDKLLAELGTVKVQPAKKARGASIPKPALVTEPGVRASNFRLIAMITIIAFTVILPAFILSGFLPNNVSLTNEIAIVVALIGGAVAGAISRPGTLFNWKGMVVGIVYGLGTLWAAVLYMQGRTSIFKFEILIPMLLGGIPALIVYFLLSTITKALAPK